MSKKLSYTGKLDIGTEDRIRLSTMKGKVGYRIVKFQIIPVAIGTTDYETVAQIFNKKQTNIGNLIDFSNSELLAVAYQKSESSSSAGPFGGEVIIFDNRLFNQDIFINITSAGSFTNPVNYYIELETMDLNDLEATYLTLQNIKTVTSTAV